MKSVAAVIVAGALVSSASAGIRISEWMYQGANGEFIELVNVGGAPIDMAGWSYDDDSRLPGTVDLSSFGVVNPGEAVVITEADESVFRAAWNLAASVKVFGGLTVNLGRNDEINIYDAAENLVDRLTYGDQNFPGTIRTQNRSGWNTPVGATPWGNVTTDWVLSSPGDGQDSWTSSGGDIGSPGTFVPTPGAVALAMIGLAGIGRRRR